MKKNYQGSFTVEAAVLVPMILWVLMLILFLLFYYHDKNVATAIAHETVVMASSQEETTQEEVENYFEERIKGKLILFSGVHVDAEITEEEVAMIGTASKKKLKLKIEVKMSKTVPEKEIRSLRRLQKLGEEIGGKS